jgi:large exoprotein involved in heme utilization and adhesion
LIFFGKGKAGNITVNTRTISSQCGVIETTNRGIGKAGDITLNAAELIEIAGRTTTSFFVFPAVFANSSPSFAGTEASLKDVDAGSSGNLTVNSRRLIVRNGAQIGAGKFYVEGGNIQLQTQEMIQRHQSLISTTAGQLGNRGNITIYTQTLVALENSYIKANVQRGAGGNITLNTQGHTQGIFGIKLRSELTPESDITASSEFGLSGTITINNPDVDPTYGLIKLPENITDPTQQIVTGCAANQGNSFIVTGRGGLPPDPTPSVIRSTIVWQDLRDISLIGENEPASFSISSAKFPDFPRSDSANRILNANRPDEIIEATGWVIAANGTVELIGDSAKRIAIANRPNPTINNPVECGQPFSSGVQK